ncbi:ANK1-like protein [Mya arenaria]|uniref:ANK1-like protein n=1 Tax=Mya arenaria TaxID=6604 RepID=A0ABY7EDG5_MYAAR|nr:ANK1-like protein [Mya arenaria]
MSEGKGSGWAGPRSPAMSDDVIIETDESENPQNHHSRYLARNGNGWAGPRNLVTNDDVFIETDESERRQNPHARNLTGIGSDLADPRSLATNHDVINETDSENSQMHHIRNLSGNGSGLAGPRSLATNHDVISETYESENPQNNHARHLSGIGKDYAGPRSHAKNDDVVIETDVSENPQNNHGRYLSGIGSDYVGPSRLAKSNDVIIETDESENPQNNHARYLSGNGSDYAGSRSYAKSDDVIIETDESENPQTPQNALTSQFQLSNSRAVSRHKSDVFTKQAVSRTASAPSRAPSDVSTTRRSVSRTYSQKTLQRHGSTTSLYRMPKYTNAFKSSLEDIDESRAILICGAPGSGKTHLAYDLMQALLADNPDYDPIILPSTLELSVLRNAPSPVILLVDDCFGTCGSNRKYCNEIKKQLMILTTALEKRNIFIILTTNSHRLVDLQESEMLFVTELKCKMMDLSSNDNLLSSQEKQKMLTSWSNMYCLDLAFNSQDIRKLVECYSANIDEEEIGFPALCQLVGIGVPNFMFENPFGALDYYLTNLKERQPHTFACIVHVILSSPFYLNAVKKDAFKTVREFLHFPGISMKDSLNCVGHLKDKGILVEKPDSSLEISSRLVYLSTIKLMMHEDTNKCMHVLPVSAINAVKFQTHEMDPEEHTSAYQRVSCQLDLQITSAIIVNFSNRLESKCPSVFFEVASSKLWEHTEFFENVFRIYGYHLFFFEDSNKKPFSSYLVRTGNVEPIPSLLQNISKVHKSSLATVAPHLEATKLEACSIDYEEVIALLFRMVPDITKPMVRNAIEHDHTDLSIQLLQSAMDSGSSHIDSELLRTVCFHGNYDLLRFILGKMSERQIQTEIRKRDSSGMSLLHHAAVGGNVHLFSHLVKLGMDPHGKARNRKTVLHFCATYGNLDLFKYISSQYEHMLNEIEEHELHCAHLAAREGHKDILKSILDTGISIDLKAEGSNSITHFAAINGWTRIINMIILLDEQQIYKTNQKCFAASHLAAKFGHTDTLEFLIENGVDPFSKTIDKRTFAHISAFGSHRDTVQFLIHNYPECCLQIDADGNSVLHDAAAGGNVDVFNDIVAAGVDPLKPNEDGASVLHDACYYGKLEMVKFLCSRFPDMVHARTKLGLTPVFGAALGGFVEVLKYMDNKKASMDLKTEEDSTLLHEAAFMGRLECVQYLAQKYPALVNRQNLRSFMPCHFAAQEGHLDVLLFLLPRSPSEFPKTKEKQTVLHISAYNRMLHIVKYLCQKFPSLINNVDTDGAFAVHYAARGGSIECFDHIVEKGCSPYMKTTAKSTVLHLAAHDGNYDMVLHICQKYPKLIHDLDSTGHSPAHYAAGSGELPLLLNVLRYGVNPLIKSECGATLLMKAAWNGKIEVVKYLCNNYPELKEARDFLGCYCLHYAACGGHNKMIEFLLSEGLDTNMVSNEGHNILQVAIYHEKSETVQYLCEAYPELAAARDNVGKTAMDYARQIGNSELIRVLSTLDSKRFKQSVASEVFCCEDGCCSGFCEGLASIFCFCRK